jgi:hypothetical protein
VFALHLYATRYLLPLVPLLVIALARGVQYVWEIIHWRAAAVILGSSILAIYTAAFFRQAIVPHPRPWEDLETAVEQQYRPGDTVIFDVLYAEVPFDYYARQRGFHPQETGFPLSIYSWWDSQWFKGWGGPVILQSDLDRFTANLSASNSRTLWLVLSETNYYDPHQALLARLRGIGQVTELQLPQEPRAGTADESPRLIRVSLR